ncbi:MAG: hypothetical protein ACTS6G_05760 [Candidatus Hodgkinia cicadicola]
MQTAEHIKCWLTFCANSEIRLSRHPKEEMKVSMPLYERNEISLLM